MKKGINTSVNKDFKKKVVAELNNSKSIVITSHIGPDDDSISSVLATYYYLINYLIISKSKVSLIYTGSKSSRWDYFVNYKKIRYVDDLANHLDGVDTLVILDGSGWKRISEEEAVQTFKGKTICIDHHPYPDNVFDLHLLDKNKLSTAEIVYDLFFAGKKLDKKICEVLLLGILGDTGNFRFVTPETASCLSVTRRLVEEGDIMIENLQTKYQAYGWNVFLTLSILMNNARVVKLDNWPPLLVSSITKEEIGKAGINESELDEGQHHFTNYLKSINNIPWGMVVVPGTEGFGVSLRSIPGSVRVNDIMMKTGFGGGHVRAAGGRIKADNAKEAVDIMMDWLSTNKPMFG